MEDPIQQEDQVEKNEELSSVETASVATEPLSEDDKESVKNDEESLPQLLASIRLMHQHLSNKISALVLEISNKQKKSEQPGNKEAGSVKDAAGEERRRRVIERCEAIDMLLGKLETFTLMDIKSVDYQQLRRLMRKLNHECRKLKSIHSSFDFDVSASKPLNPPKEVNAYLLLERNLKLSDKEVLKAVLLSIAQEDKQTCRKVKKAVQKVDRLHHQLQKVEQKKINKDKFRLVMIDEALTTTPNTSNDNIENIIESMNQGSATWNGKAKLGKQRKPIPVLASPQASH